MNDADKTKEELLAELAELRKLKLKNEEAEPPRNSDEAAMDILNNLDEAVFIKDEQHRWVFVNDRFCKMFGLRRDDLAGRSEYDVFAEEEARSSWATDDHVFKTGEARTDEQKVTWAGKKHILRIYKSVSISHSTGKQCIVGTFRDITEQKLTQSVLHRKSELLHALMNNSPDHIFFKDRKSRYVLTSKAYMELLGITENRQCIGRTDFDLLPEALASRFFSEERHVYQTGKPIEDSEVQVEDRTGNKRWVSTTRLPLKDEGGKVTGLIGMGRDITSRKTDENEKAILLDQLNQSRRLESLGHLAGGIAHDFNNMLAAIMGYANLIKRRMAQDNPDLDSYTTTIIEASQQAADLTAKLLAFARRGKYRMEAFRFQDVIRDVIKLLEHTIDKRIEIAWRQSSTPATVMGDRTQIQNAILNIAVNARDAMPKGGRMTFATEIVAVDDNYAHSCRKRIQPGDYVLLSLSDTGVGMDQETMAKIFEPFFTTKEQGAGTGLGLASAYGTVEHHRGAIEVHSEVNRGSVFRLYLPLTKQSPAEQTAKPSTIRKGAGRIMVVDDEAYIRDLSTDLLSGLGYSVVTCKDGVEAVEYFREHHDEIDLAIIDMIMPRMGGHECVMGLRSIDPNLKIVIATGYSLESDTHKLLAKGVAGFLEKPFDEDELTELLAEILPLKTE